MPPKDYRRNFAALATDFCFFGLAMAFIGPTTVIPGLLSALGASAAVIGLITTLQRAGWLLPQLFAARALADKPYKKPAIVWAAALSRPLFFVLAGVTAAAGHWPAALLIALFVPIYTAFWVGDGFGSLAWFDLLSKAIPPRRRGRLFSVGQITSGILSFLAGFAVEGILSDHGPAFPYNYASLLLLGFGMLMISLGGIMALREAPGMSEKTVPQWRDFLPQLGGILKGDPTFRRYIVARQLYNLSLLAMPFYMTYALDILHLPDQVAGRYTSIGVGGSVLAALLFGWLNERHGARRAMQASTLLTIVVPLTAILIPQWIRDPGWLAWGYGIVFFVLNAANNSLLPAWTAFLLELAPEARRPAYVGLTNTINGVTTLFSTLGGLLLQWTGDNYSLLFLVTAAGTALAWPVLISLPDPRHTVIRNP